MSHQFKAMLLSQEGNATRREIVQMPREALPEGDVLVAVEYSSINYKDALAVTGTGKIVRSFPMVPGIDLAGTVAESDSPAYRPGDKVVLTGWSVGERFWGGYSQMQRVKSEWLVPLPRGLDTRTAMALGTAGFTAMLCVQTLIDAGLRPDQGPVLVTGAAGGVGSVAISVLHALGYEVTALVSPAQAETEAEYLAGLGAKNVIAGEEWSRPPLPLEKQRWAGAIDTVGSLVLARALAETHYGGTVAACGLAGGADLPTSVMPFILRGVRLMGVDSVMCPTPRRKEIWERIAQTMPSVAMAQIADEVSLEGVPGRAEDMLAGRSRGRALVNLAR